MWFGHSDYLQKISKDLLRPTQQYYSEESLKFKLIQQSCLRQRHMTAVNKYNESIYGVLIERKQSLSQYCIVFMHGLSSNILEGFNLIDHLLPNTSLFCFDFTGSGKSQGSINTYGLKERFDLTAVLQMLLKQGYTQFIVWGRSMGAAACLLSTADKKFTDQIILQILDSPFASFQSVCEFYGSKSMGIPKLLISPAVKILQESFSSHPFNPFEIDLRQSARDCCVPTIFVYSREDEVVPCSDSEELIKNLKNTCYYQRIIIRDSHNAARSRSSLQLVFQRIRRYLHGRQRTSAPKSKKKAIDVFSKLLKKTEDRQPLTEMPKQHPIKREAHRRSAIFCSLNKKSSRFLSPSLKKTAKLNPDPSLMCRKC